MFNLSIIFALLLNNCVGARPLGMGGAFIGLANDVNAVYWNPAGLAQINKYQMTYTYGEHFGYSNFFAIGYKIHQNQALGFALIDIAKFAEEEKKSDYWLYASYSIKLMRNLFIGTNIALAKSPKDDTSYDFGLLRPDIGILYYPHSQIGLGLLVQRCYYLRPGVSFKVLNGLTLTYDIYDLFHRIKETNYHYPFSCFGIECQITKGVTLRTGFYDRYPTFGLGAEIGNFSFDFSTRGKFPLLDYRLASNAGFTLKF